MVVKEEDVILNDTVLGEFIPTSNTYQDVFGREYYDWLGIPVELSFTFSKEDNNRRNFFILHEICANKAHWDITMFEYGKKYLLEKNLKVKGMRLFDIFVEELGVVNANVKIGAPKYDFIFTYAVKYEEGTITELMVCADLENGVTDVWTDVYSKEGFEIAQTL